MEIVDRKLLRGSIRVEGILAKQVNKILLKAGWGNQTPPGGRRRLKKLIEYGR